MHSSGKGQGIPAEKTQRNVFFFSQRPSWKEKKRGERRFMCLCGTRLPGYKHVGRQLTQPSIFFFLKRNSSSISLIILLSLSSTSSSFTFSHSLFSQSSSVLNDISFFYMRSPSKLRPLLGTHSLSPYFWCGTSTCKKRILVVWAWKIFF